MECPILEELKGDFIETGRFVGSAVQQIDNRLAQSISQLEHKRKKEKDSGETLVKKRDAKKGLTAKLKEVNNKYKTTSHDMDQISNNIRELHLQTEEFKNQYEMMKDENENQQAMFSFYNKATKLTWVETEEKDVSRGFVINNDNKDSTTFSVMLEQHSKYFVCKQMTEVMESVANPFFPDD